VFDVKLTNSANKFLKNCHSNVFERIAKKIEKLRIQPYLSETISIKSNVKQYRVRVGNYRIIYRVDEANKVIFIIKIDKRSKIYKRT